MLSTKIFQTPIFLRGKFWDPMFSKENFSDPYILMWKFFSTPRYPMAYWDSLLALITQFFNINGLVNIKTLHWVSDLWEHTLMAFM